MKYKALICDVDGTLIPNRIDGVPSQRVIDAIAKAKDSIHIGIATSRPLYLARPIFQLLQLSGPSILHGGADIIDVTTEKNYFKEHIKKGDIIKIYQIVKECGLNIHIDEEDGHTLATDNYPFDDAGGAVVLGANPEDADMLFHKLNELHTVMPHKIPSWQKDKVDVSITPMHATKQQGIQRIAEVLHIETHEIIGIGDGYNDFPLLMACGLKVAMGNAVDELKAIADYVAPSVDDDGVADVIEKFVLS